MIDVTLRNYPRSRLLAACGLCLMSLNYIVGLKVGGGGDLGLRMSEALYFMHGVNPYRVLVGEIPPRIDYGLPAAYPIWSYYYSYPYALLGAGTLSRLVFAVVDICCLILATMLIASRGERLSLAKLSMYWPAFFLMSLSVFFFQQAANQNFNCQVAFFIALVFYGVENDRLVPVVIGATLLAIKPSFALPVYVYLLMQQRWKALSFISAALLVLLLVGANHVNENPLDLLVQTWRTQERFSGLQSGGLLSFLREFLGNAAPATSSIIGVIALLALLYWFRSRVWLSCGICVSVSLAFFFNQVHAATVFFLILVVALRECTGRQLLIALTLGLLFLDVPRLYGIFHSDLYIEVSNLLRFSIPFVTLYFVAKNPTAKVVGTAQPADLLNVKNQTAG